MIGKFPTWWENSDRGNRKTVGKNSSMVGNFPQWKKKSLPLHGSFSTAAPVLFAGIHLPLFSQCTLLQRVLVLEVYIFSKAWYFAQVLPLPAAEETSLCRILGDLGWAYSLARLAFLQLHRSFSQGGLGLSSPVKRAKSLQIKQVFHHLAAGRPCSSTTGSP
jgi:hypothetical protein